MKKNVAGQKIGGQLVSATDGSAFTGAVTVYVTGDAGTQAAGSVGSGACTHEGQGYHTYAPAQAETNYDLVAFTFTGSGAVPATVQVFTSFPQTGDSFDRLGAPAGASVSVDVAAIKAETATILSDTNDIQTRIPAALVSGRMDSSVGAMAANVLTATAIAADAITDAKVASDVTIASVTGAVGSVTGAVGSVTGAVGSVTGNVGGNVSGSVGSVTGNVGGNVTGSVGSIATGGIAAASFAAGAIDAAAIATDALGALELAAGAASEIATAVRSELTTELGRIDVAVSTRLAAAGYTTPLDAAGVRTAVGLASADLDTQLAALPTAAENADAVWEEAIADHSGTVGSTAEALAAAGSAGDPWVTALPGAYTAGQAGYIVGTNVNATVSSRATQTSVDDVPTNAELATALGTADDAVLAILGTPAGASLAADVAAVKTQTAAIETDTQDIQSRLPAALVSGRMDSSTGAMAANVMTAAAAAADLTTELQSGLATASALATLQTTADAIPTNAELATALGDIPTADENADALLNRDMATGADTNARSPRNALRFLRNKWGVAGTTLTVTKEDDTTEAWTATVTATPGADPVTGSDPA
jgi:hypothetical protein